MDVAEKQRLQLAPRALRREIASLVRIPERRVARLDARIDAALAENAERHETAALLPPGGGPRRRCSLRPRQRQEASSTPHPGRAPPCTWRR
jgi:hypothetical protein